MSKKYAVMLHGRADNLEITADAVDSTPDYVRFFSNKTLVAEFPQHSIIGYYDMEKGKFSYE